jgi:AbrB family looped-hinge helix DNA binding protein
MLATTVKLSSKGQVVIPKDVRDLLHWGVGVELVLLTTEHGVMLQTKSHEKKKRTAKSLRGFLQHEGEPVPTEQLCKPVEYDYGSF